MFGRTLPASRPLRQFLDARFAERRIFSHRLAGADAEHAGALDQQQIGAGKPDAAGKADHQQPRAPGDAAHAVLENLAADGIEHHVGAAPVGDALDGVAERLAAVEHEMIGSFCFGDRELFFRRGRGNHGRAEQLSDLDRGKPNAAAGAVHQQHFAGLELPAIDQRVIRRAVRREKRRALGIIERPTAIGVSCDGVTTASSA